MGVSTLIKQVKKFDEMKIFLGKVYYALAAIGQTKLPEDSLEHFYKAREIMLQGYLPQDHPDISMPDHMIVRQTGSVQGIKAGRLKIVSRQE